MSPTKVKTRLFVLQKSEEKKKKALNEQEGRIKT